MESESSSPRFFLLQSSCRDVFLQPVSAAGLEPVVLMCPSLCAPPPPLSLPHCRMLQICCINTFSAQRGPIISPSPPLWHIMYTPHSRVCLTDDCCDVEPLKALCGAQQRLKHLVTCRCIILIHICLFSCSSAINSSSFIVSPGVIQHPGAVSL